MGHLAARDRFLVDLSRTVGIVASKSLRTAVSERVYRRAGFAHRAIPAEVSSFQISVDVGRGETNQRRRLLVESDRARLSLLVATVADHLRVVGGSTPRMVQAFLRGILFSRRDHRAFINLGATPSAASRRRTDHLSADRDRDNGKLLLLQSADDRALFVAD